MMPVFMNPLPWLDPVYGGSTGSLGRNMNGLNCRRGGPLGCGCTMTRSAEGCGPNVIVWISDFEAIEKCTDCPALIVRVAGGKRKTDTVSSSCPAGPGVFFWWG